MTPSSIPLGNVEVGAVSSSTITVKNNKAVALPLSVLLSGADITKDATSTCSTTLAANGSCTVVVAFKALTSGPKTDSVAISGNGVTKEVAITATALNPAKISASPATVTLATVVGQTDSKQVVVVNQGDMPTGIVTASISGADLTVVGAPECLAPIAGAKYCTFTVSYAPKAATTTPVSGTLTIIDPTSNTVTVGVTATANSVGAPVITGSADFGSVVIGSTSAASTLTVTNNNDTATGALAVTVPAPFVKVTDTCSTVSLPKGGACAIGIQFKPTAVGVVNGLLTVVGATGTASKALTGTGIPGAGIEIAPVSIDFLSVRLNSTATAKVVTVSNKGGSATGPLTFVKTGDHGMFPITGNTCSAALAQGTSCTFSINFAPTTLAGSKNAVITVTDGTLSANLSVAGNALDAAGIKLNDSDYDFGGVVVLGTSSPKVFSVSIDKLPAGTTDTGAITATITGANAADFAITANTCTAPLVAGSCDIQVVFTPKADALGLRQAALTVNSVNGGYIAAGLQGTGLPIVGVYACVGTLDSSSHAPGAPTGLCGEVSQAAADLDFGQVSLNPQAPKVKTFLAVVRGPIDAATTATVVLTDPAASGSNFANYVGGTANQTNPCNNAVLDMTKASLATPVTPDVAAADGGTWYYDATTKGYWCQFQVQFLPQGTVKGAKTATLAATSSGTGGGSDSKTITGEATGPLTITLNQTLTDCGVDFPANVAVNTSTNDDQTYFTTCGESGTLNRNKHLIVTNNSTTATIGPLSVSKTGDDFFIVGDECTGKSLAPNGTCNLVIAFRPTSVGAKTGTVTVAGSSETQTYNLTANGSQGFTVTLTPASTALAPVDLGSVIQGNTSTAVTFTISNPTGAAKTNQFTWQSNDATHFVVSGDGATGCGASGLKALEAGQSCTLTVVYKPQATDELVKRPGTFTVNVNSQTLTGYVAGTALSKLTVTSALPTTTLTGAVTAYSFGDVAVSADSTAKMLTVANVSAAGVTVNMPSSLDPFSIVDGGTCVITNGQFPLAAAGAAGASCTIAVKMTGRTEEVTLPFTEDPAISATFSDAAAGATSTATARLTGRTVRRATLDVVGLPLTGDVAIDLGSIVNPNSTAPVTLTFKNNGDVPAVNVKFNWSIGDGDVTCTASADGKTCDPFVVLSETTGQSCFGLSSLAAGATCKLTIKSAPASSLTQGQKSLHFTVTADSGIASATSFQLLSTIRRSDTTATQIYFDYPYPTATSPLLYGFLPFPGTTAVGANSAQIIVRLENKSGESLTLPAADAWADLVSTTDFVVAPAGTGTVCGTSLAANSTCLLGVTFTPQTYSTTSVFKFASLTVAGNTLGLMGQVKTPAILTIKPTTVVEGQDTVDFGEVAVGSTKAITLTVKNEGDTDATALSFTNSNTDGFVLSGCGTELAAGATCNLVATAVPISTETITGTITAAYTGGASGGDDTSPVVVAMTATGVGATSLTVTAADGAALVATTDANAKTYAYSSDNSAAVVVRSSDYRVKTFRITNAANRQTSNALVISLTNTSDFTLVKTDCMASETVGLKLAGGQSCDITVTFKPVNVAGTTVPSTMTTTLSVSDGGTAKTVAITGTAKSALDFYASAEAADPLTSPTTVTAANYGTDLYVKQNTTVTGSTALMTMAGLSGTAAASFFITQNQCILNAVDGENLCIISVQYVGSATAAAASVSAVLTVSDGTIGNTAAITVQNPAPSGH